MKPFIFLFLTAISFCGVAQPGKGSFLISGNMSYAHNVNNTGQTRFHGHTFSISPKVGYFFSNRFCLGISLPINFSAGTHEDIITPNSKGRNHNRGIGIGPFVRYYIPINEKLFFISQVSFSWGFDKSISNSTYLGGNPLESKSTFKTTQLDIGAGLSYFLSKNIGVEMLVNFSGYSYNPNGNGGSLNAQTGLQIYINR